MQTAPFKPRTKLTACALHATPIAGVDHFGHANDNEVDLFGGGDAGNRIRIGIEFAARLERLPRRGDGEDRLGNGYPNSVTAEINAEQPQLAKAPSRRS